MALRNIGVNYEVVGISEIDKYAIKAYESTHGKVNNLGDISKINVEDVPDHDIFTYSFPCQDISTAGKQASLEEGSGTRSSLLWECKKIIENKKPKYLLMENVKNLVSKKHKPYFDKWLEYLEGLGYTNYWKVLNAKDFGVPQNRERIFVVSTLDNTTIEMDNFTKKTGNLQSYLEENVSIKTKPSCMKVFDNEFNDILQSDKEIYQCDVKSGFQDCKIGLKVAPTIRANNTYTHVLQYKFPDAIKLDKMIAIYRRITPREAFRLMGVSDQDIDKIQSAGISNTQQYKMAGNSIVVQVLEHVFKNLLL
jgi:DNA (cytosine-5)-methyltransferase 1